MVLLGIAVGAKRVDELVDDIVVRQEATPETSSFSDLWSAAGDEMPWVVELRRELHRTPELMFAEHETSAKIAAMLTSLGVSFTAGWAANTKHAELEAKGFKSGVGRTGIVAEIGTGREPCVLLRADIDALPIHESASLQLPFASETPGKMHACGHDAHAAMLVGAAALLKKREGTFNGTVRLIWQPAEEGGAGGKRMLEEGVLTKLPAVGAAFGFHQWPYLPLGTVGARSGTMMAACELFDITIHGSGGHAAMPHLAKDPIVAAAAVVLALQTLASRETSPLEAAVISVTMIHAGDAYNVIPDGAQVAGTLRSLTNDGLERLRASVRRVVEHAVSAHRCNATISWSPDAYPPTANDPHLFEWVQTIAADASVDGKIQIIEPTMGGEDFSFLAREVPAVFLALGQGDKAWDAGFVDDAGEPIGPLDTTVTVHNSKFVLNENVLQRGVALHAHLALSWLAKATA